MNLERSEATADKQHDEDVHEAPTTEEQLNTVSKISEARISIEDLSIPVEEAALEVNNYLLTVSR